MVTRQGIMVTWKALAAGLVGVLACIGAWTIVQAAQQKGGVQPLTAADRLEIQQLLARYMYVLDSCPDHNDGYDYADLYTDDGMFGTRKGREELARAAGRTANGGCEPHRYRGPINQVHLNVAPIIEPDPQGARGISYLMMADGPANEIYWSGWYQDIYARTPKGWRFKSRLHVGGPAAGIAADLSAARMQWEVEPTPAGSRTLLGKAAPRPAPIAGDPLKWLESGKPSLSTGN
jgi:hypothetical protein